MRTKNKFIVFILSILSIFFISCGKKVEKIEVLSLGKIVKIGEPIMKVTLK